MKLKRKKTEKTSSYVEPQKKGENREKKILALEAPLVCCEPPPPPPRGKPAIQARILGKVDGGGEEAGA